MSLQVSTAVIGVAVMGGLLLVACVVMAMMAYPKMMARRSRGRRNREGGDEATPFQVGLSPVKTTSYEAGTYEDDEEDGWL
jgi:hypothetical protein